MRILPSEEYIVDQRVEEIYSGCEGTIYSINDYDETIKILFGEGDIIEYPSFEFEREFQII